MPTKPTSTYVFGTDAVFSSGPATGLATKIIPPSLGQGFIPGTGIAAEHINYLHNIVGAWLTDWIEQGSSVADADAHIVETDALGRAAAVELTAGGNIQSTSALGYFGDGTNGNVTIAAPTTMTEDMHAEDLTVNADLNTNGFRIFVRGTLTIAGAASIAANGAVGADGNSGGAGGTGAGSSTGSPGDGAAGSSNANGVNSPTMANYSLGGDGGGGGQNGAGDPVRTAGVGGGSTPPTAAVGSYRTVITAHGVFMEGTPILPGAGGAGGVGGDAGIGGGGGQGGKMLIIFANRFDSLGELHADGGVGGQGQTTPDADGNGGGGGGGGGVVVRVVREMVSAGVAVASGGLGGAAGVNGTAGSVGSAGLVLEFNV